MRFLKLAIAAALVLAAGVAQAQTSGRRARCNSLCRWRPVALPMAWPASSPKAVRIVGQRVYVENKPGGNTILGTDAVVEVRRLMATRSASA